MTNLQSYITETGVNMSVTADTFIGILEAAYTTGGTVDVWQYVITTSDPAARAQCNKILTAACRDGAFTLVYDKGQRKLLGVGSTEVPLETIESTPYSTWLANA